MGPVVQMAEIPPHLYYLIGVSVIANLGTIGSVLYFGGRVIWWASKIDQRVAHTEDEVVSIKELILRRH